MERQEAIRILLDEYAQRRAREEEDRNSRIENVRREHPEIAELLDEERRILIQGARALTVTGGDTHAAAQMMHEKTMQHTKLLKEAIAKAWLPEDVLSLRVQCPLCKDTGYIENSFPARFCSCFENALSLALSDSVSGTQSFEAFDLSVFPDTQLPGRTYSQREQAERVGKFLRSWADAYPGNRLKNITLLGKSGIGKTFLLNCVAQRLRQRGYPVMQITAFRMVEAMRKRHFGSYEAHDLFDEMLEAPCLSIDDLGSEPLINNISVEYLFTLLNERASAGLATFVATNLTMSELRTRYNERISSRLLDTMHTNVIPLEGIDLRTREGAK